MRLQPLGHLSACVVFSLTQAQQVIPNAQVPFRILGGPRLAAAQQPEKIVTIRLAGESDILLRVAEPQARGLLGRRTKGGLRLRCTRRPGRSTSRPNG